MALKRTEHWALLCYGLRSLCEFP